jgi:hypothetical protein
LLVADNLVPHFASGAGPEVVEDGAGECPANEAKVLGPAWEEPSSKGFGFGAHLLRARAATRSACGRPLADWDSGYFRGG